MSKTRKWQAMTAALMALVLAVAVACAPPEDEAGEENGAAPDETISLRLAHVVTEDDSFHVAAVEFKELVEERTDGQVEIDIYPNAELGDERTLLEGMQMGTIDMGVITNGPVANFYPEIAAFEMPFLFEEPQQAHGVLDGPIGQDMLDGMEEVGFKGLAYAERGFRNVTNSVHQVDGPQDLEGLTLRVMENPVYVDTFEELNVDVVPMAWTEALTALEQGTIDGQENPVNVIHSFELWETQDYMSLTRHTYAPALVMMSLEVWEDLPADVQEVFQESAQDAAEHARQVNMDMEEEWLEDIEEEMELNRDPDIDAFRDAVEPVYEAHEDELGEVVEQIQQEL